MPLRRSAASSWSVSDWQTRLGRKVSIRFRIHDDPSHAYSEAVGVVQSVTEDDDGLASLTLVDRRGKTSSVPIADIEAAKEFPS